MPQSQTVNLPQRLPLVIEPSNRGYDTDADAKLVNAYVETRTRGQSVECWIYKRAGLQHGFYLGGQAQGMFNWLGDVYAVSGGVLYKNGVNVGTVSIPGGVYKFNSTLGATPRLIFGNGVASYYYDGTTLTQITDANFPGAPVKGWSYLDGTLYVMDQAANIHGSNINDPSTWDALNKIVAQIEPDKGVALAKQLVYAIAMKEWTTEVFYDAGNTTGSPLAPVQGGKISFGCASAESVQTIDDTLFWLSNTRSSAVQAITMDGLKAQIISTKPVERLIGEIDMTTVFSWQFKDSGHSFYGVTSREANITLVYDVKEKSWAQWTDADGNYFPFVSCTYDSNRKHLFQHESNGSVYYLDQDFVDDDGSPITVDIITPNFDGDTRRRKHLNAIEFIGDQTEDSILQVRYNDSDYDPSSWSSWRQVDMQLDRAILSNNGTFRRRAYQIRHQAPTKLRLQAVELQLDLGTL